MRVNRKLAHLRKATRLKPHSCYSNNCNNLSIRTHILQKSRILKNVSQNGKVVQLTDLDPRLNGGVKYKFKLTGINDKRSDVLNYWGFCNSCDDRIFAPIEKIDEIDYESYKTHVLLSYRGYLSEIYKQEYNLKWYDLIFKAKDIPDQTKEIFRDLYVKFSMGIKDGQYFRKLFQSEIESDYTQNFFLFKKFVLPKFEIFSSTSYSHPKHFKFRSRNEAEFYIAQLNPNDVDYVPQVLPIFFNLIPEKEGLIVIIGKLNKNLFGLATEEFDLDFSIITVAEKFVTDVLIKRVETWGLSINLWENWKSIGLDKTIIELIHKYLPVEMKFKDLDFNLFSATPN